MVTVPGIIMVARYRPKSLPKPLKGSLANTKAAMQALSTCTRVVASARKRLLRLALPKEKPGMLNTRI